ncbi:MAG TPA: glycoside hydrolase family 43 protein [Vicinamibacterales bacterium]|nr:glycoside hydrolase family 43 protein [Vicinamibacterales bacterium]
MQLRQIVWIRILVLTLLAAFTTAPAAAARQDESAGASPAPRYLFSYFTGNGEDGLHFAASADGLTWTALRDGKSVLAPAVGSKLMRDPCVLRGPDGTFHMVWTTGWWDRGIGYASSKDLITWSEQKWIPVMEHEPDAVNAWAPELFYDRANGQFLIFWASTVRGRFPETAESGDPGGPNRDIPLNHRMYYVATKDFRTFSPARLLYDGGFNAIDATIIEDGGEFVMIVKDETKNPVARKHLRVARAPNATGPYGPASPPITPDWVEGPTGLKVGDRWIVYYDEYTRARYGAIRSKDLRSWEIITDRIRFPEGVRHGTAFEVDPATIARLSASR